MFGIFIGEQKGLLRDRATMFIVMLFPALLVFILGTLLGNLDNPDRTVDPFRLAYVIDSTELTTVATAETVVAEFDEVEQVSFVEYDDLASVAPQLESGAVGAVVVFTEPFAIEIHEGLDPTQNRVVHTIFEGVARLHGSITVAGEVLQSAASAQATGSASVQVAGTETPQATDAAPAQATGSASAQPLPSSLDPAALTSGARVEEKTYGVTRTMMDYYAITMIVMMFFMASASSGASTFYEMRKDGTLRRILTSPLNRTSVYLQLLVSKLPMNIVQVGIVMAASALLFGAHYAASWQLNVLLFAMLTVAGFAFSALFLLIGMFLRVNPLIFIIPVMWAVLFCSGTFSKEIFIPNFTPFMPSYLIQTAAFDLTLFGNTGQAFGVCAVSLALIVLSTVAGTLILRRREAAL
jgi:ABC-2 type transport system permease protein